MAIRIGEDGTIISGDEVISSSGTVIRDDGTIESSNIAVSNVPQRSYVSHTAPVSPLDFTGILFLLCKEGIEETLNNKDIAA